MRLSFRPVSEKDVFGPAKFNYNVHTALKLNSCIVDIIYLHNNTHEDTIK
jgi:hypothetical protein